MRELTEGELGFVSGGWNNFHNLTKVPICPSDMLCNPVFHPDGRPTPYVQDKNGNLYFSDEHAERWGDGPKINPVGVAADLTMVGSAIPIVPVSILMTVVSGFLNIHRDK